MKPGKGGVRTSGRTRAYDWLDSATDDAVQPTPLDGMTYTSLDLTVKFLRRMSADTSTVRAVGTAINSSGRAAVTHAHLVDAAGHLLAHATSSCLLLSVPDHRA
ncbi:hypothetical protein ACFXC8_41600 [Streptomyces sp. NPDC059441]|uniref:hypothetical protein n=1 Tax=Streptomyces sp. NPDC059441 TaxID=3346829 RepID=UPI003674B1FF